MNEKSTVNPARDFLGILILGFTLFLLLALISYRPQDPSFNNYLSNSQVHVHNQGGIVGAYISDAIIQLFGSGAFVFPIVALILGWALIRGRRFQSWMTTLAAGVLLLVSLCSLLSLQYAADPYFGDSVQAGGMAGTFCGGILKHWLNNAGACLASGTFIIVALLALTGTALNSLIDAAGNLAKATGTAAFDALQSCKGFCRQGMDRFKNQNAGKKSKPSRREPVIVSQRFR
ncbi:MAG: DNA translocase FtsK 4TM domain-containing protein, partial [Nitrospinales bacterium]